MSLRQIKIGIDFDSARPVREILPLAMEADRQGADSIWVSDAGPVPPFSDTFVSLSAVALNTSRATIGTAISTPYIRHPASYASALLALNSLSKGRAVAGIGPGGPSVLRRLGIDEVKAPARAMKEAVLILRRLFNGEKVDHEGEFFRVRNVFFEHPGRRIPIYVSARHQHMLRVVGEVADGSLLDGPPGYVVKMLPHIEDGAKRAGRELGDLDIGHVTYVSVDPDIDRALEAARAIAPYQIAFQSPLMLHDAGVSESLRQEVRSLFERKGLSALREAASLVPDKVVQQLAVVGDVNGCVKRFLRLAKMGITHFVVHWPYGADEATGIRLLVREARPAVLREFG